MKANVIQTYRRPATRSSGLWQRAAVVTVMLGLACRATADPLQIITTLDPAQGPPAGGGGDSMGPVMSADGRFVLFASTAPNLVAASNGSPLPWQFPARLNVFLRDRTNHTTTLVSVNLAGSGGGNGDSVPTGISSDGRYALFESTASDLVPGDANNAADIFVRDLTAGTTLLVSVNTNGVPGTRGSRGSVMTPDGRFVAFVSEASDLVARDTNGIADVFLRDLQSGTTALVSAGATASTSPGGGASEYPDITPDGRYVAFHSTASGLVPGTVNSGDIYVRDVVSGTTTWASTAALASVQQVTSASAVAAYSHVLSSNGQFVAYQASAYPLRGASAPAVVLRYNMQSGLTDVVSTNAVAGGGVPEQVRTLDMTPDGRYVAYLAGSNSAVCVLVWDAVMGTATLASGDPNSNVPANSMCESPSLSPDGRFVLFLCGSNLATNSAAGDSHIYLRDLQAAATMLVDVDANGAGPGLTLASVPQISADGRFVAFEYPDAGLVLNDRNRDYDLFVRDLVAGTTELISARDAALPSVTPNGSSQLSAYSLSTDGSSAAFASDADNLVPGDTNGLRDVFVRSLLFGTNALVSVATNGLGADGMSTEPAISGDGRYVAFTSVADNLVAGDANQARDVFVRDLLAGTTALVSVNSTRTGSGSGASYSPQISADGRYVLFRSLALNLAAGTFTYPYENLFVRDLQQDTTYALTHTSSGSPVGAMTPDGRVVAFFGVVPPYAAKLYVWRTGSPRLAYTNALTGIVNLGISPDGHRIAYSTSSTLSVLDWVSRTTWTVGAAAAGPHPGLRFSGDGRFLVYVNKLSNTNQVYLYDLQYSTNYLVSHAYNSTAGAYGASDWPEISSDGRFVAYRSAAPNIVPGDTNGVPDIFLYDRENNTTMLLSASLSGAVAGNTRSLAPVFSADSRLLAFESWASALAAGDFNHGSDLFACRLFGSGQVPVFAVEMLPAIGLAQRPWLTWTVVTGKTYVVQFKNSPLDAGWQTLTGGVTILGNRACLNDTSAGAGQRLYRIIEY
jgi:Tol biopolymer transport system component